MFSVTTACHFASNVHRTHYSLPLLHTDTAAESLGFVLHTNALCHGNKIMQLFPNTKLAIDYIFFILQSPNYSVYPTLVGNVHHCSDCGRKGEIRNNRGSGMHIHCVSISPYSTVTQECTCVSVDDDDVTF